MDIATAYVKRHDLTTRMSLRRFTRLTNGFSKKMENHYHALALNFTWYNFVRLHKTLRMTPAMAAGVTQTLWSMEDIAALVDAQHVPQKCGPYKKRTPEVSNCDTTRPPRRLTS